MGSSNDQLAGAIWALVRKQHGVVARRQLLELGMSEQAVQHRLERGRLYRVERGIYAVGRPGLTRRGRWSAAVLGCGTRAVLSHRSAAALWGVYGGPSDVIEVSVPYASPRRRPGVHVYRRPRFPDEERAEVDGIPVTTPVCTLVDLARVVDARRLERAVNEADRLDLIDPESLLAALDSHRGRRGVAPLRALLGDRVFRLTDSELERRFLRLVDRAGLELPLTQQEVGGHRVDFLWPRLGIVVETDGLRYHRTAAQQARDLRRDQAHTAAGLVPLRFSHAQVCFEREHVARTLVETHERRRVEAALAARRRTAPAGR